MCSNEIREWRTYVGPCDQIIRALLEGLEDGVFEDLLRDVKIVGVFNQVEGRLATAGVTTDVDERFEIGDLVRITVLGLEVDGLEKLFKCFLETMGRARLAVLDATCPVAVGENRQYMPQKIDYHSKIDVLPSELPGTNFLLGLTLGRRIPLREPVSVHDSIGKEVGLLGQHSVRDVVEMEEVAEEISNDAHAFGWAVGVAPGG